MWTRDPDAEKLVTLSYYLRDPEIRRRSWLMRRELHLADPQPNAGHAALVELERQGRLRALVTQNIDGLHQAAGSSPGPGRWRSTARCTRWCACPAATGRRCAARSTASRRGSPTRRAWSAAGSSSRRRSTSGRSSTRPWWRRCTTAATDCDVFLAVGTSLQVWPAAGLADLAVRSGARLVIVNAEPTPYDDVADLVVREPIGTSLPRLVAH